MDDTIVALSTPYGESGIGVIRLSGSASIEVAQKVFKGKRNLKDVPSHKAVFGYVINPQTGEKLDECLLLIMRGPHSYTGEDTVEFYVHGSPMLEELIIKLLVELGARLALPGEFTKRAFLNGKLDLSRAEAIIDIIQAKSEAGLKSSFIQLQGRLSGEIKPIMEDLKDLIAELEAGIDFPEEVEISYESIKERISNIIERLSNILGGAYFTRLYRKGLYCPIVGRPNVGKSSLLNILLGEERAIVTPIPGTTRDTITESISIEGIPLTLIDTAGIRETQDLVESIGVNRTIASIENADIVIWVVDASEPLMEEDLEIEKITKNKKRVIALNKIDLPDRLLYIETLELYGPVVEISCKTGEGIDRLRSKLKELLGSIPSPELVIPINSRHEALIKRCIGRLSTALEGINIKFPIDIIAGEIWESYNILGEITGETTSIDIVEEIFSRFCVGK
ncbi:MAG: tRNA uridine-5-carboxymethylaminomethyl(34) synthesis GTPase MnmE [bacterium]|nr:tRNA uridine-5-carboxymethylaminomethyl(34) synthesis GTPase MnmE [bacterium]